MDDKVLSSKKEKEMMKEKRKERKKEEKMNECWQRVGNHYPFGSSYSMKELIGSSFQIKIN